MTKTQRREEYHRRTLLAAAAEGIKWNTKGIIVRLDGHSKQPAWLMRKLAGIVERADKVSAEMIRHRDEVKP